MDQALNLHPDGLRPTIESIDFRKTKQSDVGAARVGADLSRIATIKESAIREILVREVIAKFNTTAA